MVFSIWSHAQAAYDETHTPYSVLAPAASITYACFI